MAILKYNKKECGWECSCCLALYNDDEIHRVFEYNAIKNSNFQPCYCMDCGTKWVEINMTDYENYEE